ncbi:hypothetical protein M405DRAFT_863621 [Rhizopogon salebrosus TDB-379]|nr:hypothetical protein M405DRAFT_863621 [Rhizopogon salebrosus TDB-379]
MEDFHLTAGSYLKNGASGLDPGPDRRHAGIQGLGGGLELRHRYFHNIRPTIGKVLININVSSLCGSMFWSLTSRRAKTRLPSAAHQPPQRSVLLRGTSKATSSAACHLPFILFTLPEPNYAVHLEIAEFINSNKANAPREVAILIARLETTGTLISPS